MNTIDILILAIALSIDACVVSFSNGLIFTQNKRINSLILASSVGFFQFLMPIIGFFLAQSVQKYVEPYDHWVVFGIFVLLGAKFIKDGGKCKDDSQAKKINCYFCFSYILLVSVATSIDALGAGISIAFSGVKNILIPAFIIGVVTFINSLIGFWSGQLLKKFPTRNLEISAGIILILLAFKTLFEHMH